MFKSLKKYKFSKSLVPSFLVLPVTYRCPLQCKMCSCPSQAKEMGELSIDEIQQKIYFLTSNKPKIKNVNLTGGELFLRSDLKQIVSILSKAGVQKIGVSSNCYNTELTVTRFKELLIAYPNIQWHIMTSIDGCEDVHNRTRGNNEAFINTIKTIKALRKLRNSHKFSLSINITISRENIDQASNIESYLTEIINIPFTYTYAVNSDLYINSSKSLIANQLSDSSYIEKLKTQLLKDYIQNNNYFAADIFYMIHGYKRFYPCIFYYGGYFLEPSGKFYKCSITTKSELSNNKATLDLHDAKRVTNKINLICKSCFNNCGNAQFTYPPYYFLLKSEFIKSRKKIYLSTSKIDLKTRTILKLANIKYFNYSGQTTMQNDLIIYTKYSNHFSIDDNDFSTQLMLR